MIKKRIKYENFIFFVVVNNIFKGKMIRKLNIIFIWHVIKQQLIYFGPINGSYHGNNQKRENNTSVTNNGTKNIDAVSNHH